MIKVNIYFISTYFSPQQNYQNGEVNDGESQFLNALNSSIEIFCNRMRSNQQRGRSIANDSSVQTLFMTINAMHPQLMKYVSHQEDSRGEVPIGISSVPPFFKLLRAAKCYNAVAFCRHDPWMLPCRVTCQSCIHAS